MTNIAHMLASETMYNTYLCFQSCVCGPRVVVCTCVHLRCGLHAAATKFSYSDATPKYCSVVRSPSRFGEDNQRLHVVCDINTTEADGCSPVTIHVAAQTQGLTDGSISPQTHFIFLLPFREHNAASGSILK